MKKDTITALFKVIWMSLQLAWSVFLKSVTESLFGKAAGFYQTSKATIFYDSTVYKDQHTLICQNLRMD